MQRCSDLAFSRTSVFFPLWEIPGPRTQAASSTPQTSQFAWMQTAITRGFISGLCGTTREGPCVRVVPAQSLTAHIFSVKQGWFGGED